MWLRLNPGTSSFFLVDRLRACVVNTRRSFPSRDVCWSFSLFDRAVRSREDPDLHSGVPSIIPRHFFGMFTSRSALRDMPLRPESLDIGKRGPRQLFKLLKTLHVSRTSVRNQRRVAHLWCRTSCIQFTEKLSESVN